MGSGGEAGIKEYLGEERGRTNLRFGNGRAVRRMKEQMKNHMAARLSALVADQEGVDLTSLEEAQLRTFSLEDVPLSEQGRAALAQKAAPSEHQTSAQKAPPTGISQAAMPGSLL